MTLTLILISLVLTLIGTVATVCYAMGKRSANLKESLDVVELLKKQDKIDASNPSLNTVYDGLHKSDSSLPDISRSIGSSDSANKRSSFW